MAVTIPYALTARAGHVDCPPNISSAVESDVFVDQECIVDLNGSVDGDIIVEGDNAHLRFFGELEGDILAKDCMKVKVNIGASVDGHIMVENCVFDSNIFDVIIGSTVGPGGEDDIVKITGNVEIKGSDLRIGDFAEIYGNVKVENGICDISDSAIIHGDLQGVCAASDSNNETSNNPPASNNDDDDDDDDDD